MLAEMAAVVVAQFTPCVDKRRAIAGDIGEMPVETAFGDRKAAAQPIDLQRCDALFGKDREAGLDPVVDG